MPPKTSKRKGATGYKLPDPLPEGEILSDGKKKWRLGKSIGVGGFGEIYLCSDDIEHKVVNDATHVMKIEPSENGPLFVEMHFYVLAATPSSVEAFKKEKGLEDIGIPCFRGKGLHTFKGQKYRFLVIDRFGKDLQKIFQSGKKLFSPKAAYNLAIRIIDVLEYIHSQGYVHNDIKSQNLLLGHGRTKENDVYLVDFGLVSKYMINGVHVEYKPDARKAHDGTIEYTSRDAHIGAHSRRSDLEILGYNLVHWMSGTLPWMSNLSNPSYVHTQKKGFMAEIPKFLRNCFGEENDYPGVLKDFLTYVTKLEYDTKPDYDYCRELFRLALRKLRLPYDGKVDFSAPKVSGSKKVGSPLKLKVSPKKKSPLKKTGTSSRRTGQTTKKSMTRKKVVESSDSENKTDEEEDEEEIESPPLLKKTKKSRVKKLATRETGCQTSPGFVKAAKVAAKAAKAKSINNGKEVFVKKVKDSAKKPNSSAKTTRAPAVSSKKSENEKIKSSKKEETDNDDDDDGSGCGVNDISNPTPAMLEIMRKKKDSQERKPAKRLKKSS